MFGLPACESVTVPPMEERVIEWSRPQHHPPPLPPLREFHRGDGSEAANSVRWVEKRSHESRCNYEGTVYALMLLIMRYWLISYPSHSAVNDVTSSRGKRNSAGAEH